MDKSKIRCRCIDVIVPALVMLSVTHIALGAKAESESPYGGVSMATGRAGVAANDQGEQMIMNPAAMVHGKSFVTSYFYREGYTNPSERNRLMAVSLQDNSEDILATGGFYFGKETRSFLSQPDYEDQRIQISFASFLYDQLSGGFSLVHLTRDLDDGPKYEFIEGDLGLLWNPHPDLAFGAKYENLGRHGGEAPSALQPKDRLTLGVNYLLLETVRVRFDLSQQVEENPNHRVDLRTGLESFIDAFFVLRFGFERQQLADRQYFTAGMGFTGPRLRMGYSYRKNVDYSGGALHSVDFRLPF